MVLILSDLHSMESTRCWTVIGIYLYRVQLPNWRTLARTDPDHHIQDLQEAIKSGNFPSWDVCVQTVRPEEIVDASVDLFDMTKI